MKLGGWWRLWIAVTAVYAVALVGIFVNRWETNTYIGHEPVFNSQLSKASQAIIYSDNPEGENEYDRLIKGETPKLPERKFDDILRFLEAQTLSMSNGYSFTVRSNATVAAQENLRREYEAILAREKDGKIKQILLIGLAMLFLPPLLLAGFSLLCRWIYLGFKMPK